ncbi:FAD-dependent thymidylate synthase [Aureimonas ureilytica]|uniref:FAD-dependent thymidylate synthase n=1 Tax=Aureimonas ureilytica TaxID=401562 RepID=UPI000371A830|nr:FAD-dependent thymidylate synthase [Aureimonas ureilytica]
MNTARLVAITKPLVAECKTAEEFIVFAARVSNPGNQANRETDARLLAYLIRNKHWSPFEMVSATLEVITTRDTARQMLRHRSFSFQEFSQRYAEVEGEFVEREARMQDPTNRQNSTPDAPEWVAEKWRMMQANVMHHAKGAYDAAIAAGIAKEQARAVLPEGLTPSTLYMQGSFRSWLHYLEQREAEGTQKEHREVAKAIRSELAAAAPLIFGAV